MSVQNQSVSPENLSNVSTQKEPLIHCPKCKTTNPTDADRCKQCGQNLLPGQGIGIRVFFFFFFMVLAIVFGYLMYINFIRENAPNPDSFWINPVSLSVGILLSLILAFVLSLRKIPIYKRYEKRSVRHLNLNLMQSIADLTSALETSPDNARRNLLKQRRRLYEKIGDSVNADRDRLTLALDPDAWKSEGDFLSVFGDFEGSAFSWSMRRAAIDNLVSSGIAIAVGFCLECNAVVVLNKDKKCPIHPKTRGREQELVIPADIAVGKLKVITKLAKKVPSQAIELRNLLESNKAVALAYCPQCQGIMELDPQLHCPHHPTARLKDVYFSLAYNLEAQKRQMMHKHHENKSISTRYIIAFAIILITLVIVYFALIK
jgi:hypothetical protein